MSSMNKIFSMDGNRLLNKQPLNVSVALNHVKIDAAGTNRSVAKSVHEEEIGTLGIYNHLDNQEYSSSFTQPTDTPSLSLYNGQNHSKGYLLDVIM